MILPHPTSASTDGISSISTSPDAMSTSRIIDDKPGSAPVNFALLVRVLENRRIGVTTMAAPGSTSVTKTPDGSNTEKRPSQVSTVRSRREARSPAGLPSTGTEQPTKRLPSTTFGSRSGEREDRPVVPQRYGRIPSRVRGRGQLNGGCPSLGTKRRPLRLRKPFIWQTLDHTGSTCTQSNSST